jgi:hypothetical protein
MRPLITLKRQRYPNHDGKRFCEYHPWVGIIEKHPFKVKAKGGGEGEDILAAAKDFRWSRGEVPSNSKVKNSAFEILKILTLAINLP